MRVPYDATVTWRMAVPPARVHPTTVMTLPPRSRSTVTSNVPSRGTTSTTSSPTPTYTRAASVVPRTTVSEDVATDPSAGAVSSSRGGVGRGAVA
jgi:hypothetical protein